MLPIYHPSKQTLLLKVLIRRALLLNLSVKHVTGIVKDLIFKNAFSYYFLLLCSGYNKQRHSVVID